MFQTTRRQLALWYTGVTAVLLLLFATGFYFYVRQTLVERVDDTLNHVVEIVQRSLVIESAVIEPGVIEPAPVWHVNLEASFPEHAAAVEDDHIDLEWFSPEGELLWSTFSAPTNIPLHPDSDGETVYGQIAPNAAEPLLSSFALRQVTQPVWSSDQSGHQMLGYLRVSHPWFEVTKPSRQLLRDLGLGLLLVVGAVAAIGWLLSGLAIAPIREAYQRLKQFTADASHELRNPIAVIQTNVQVALADPNPSLQPDQLQVIERLTRRLGRLVDDLLFLARQDIRQEAQPRPQISVLPAKLLQNVIEEQQALAAELDLKLRLQIAPDAAELYLIGEADQLTRLFTNLVSNALQYTPSGGQVTVTLQRQKLQGSLGIQLQVQDTGIGIPAAALPQIFDRFYRVDPARSALPVLPVGTARLAGSGLGLAIAKAIVENHQGQIEASSLPAQGSCFTVWLPCPKNAAVAPANASSASSLDAP